MNKEFIDKHEAYLLLKQKAETYMLPATKEAYERAAILISLLPTIEAIPVKHGRWIEEHTNQIQWLLNEHESYNAQDTSLTERRCSNCKLWSVDFTSRIIMNFCPMCGARMDGGDE